VRRWVGMTETPGADDRGRANYPEPVPAPAPFFPRPGRMGGGNAAPL